MKTSIINLYAFFNIEISLYIIKIETVQHLFPCQCTENPECLISLQGAAIDRILGEIVHSKSMVTPIDYVLCIGHFLGKVQVPLVCWFIINQDKSVFFLFYKF